MSNVSADISQVATSLSQSNLYNDVGLAVLKKAQETEKTIAAGLLQALPAIPSAAAEGTIGTRIDVFA